DGSSRLSYTGNDPTRDEIDFAIGVDPTLDPGPGYDTTTDVATIRPASSLEIHMPVIIDGYTQTGASPNTLKGVGSLGVDRGLPRGAPSQYGDNAVLKVVLNGSLVPKSYGNESDGLVLGAPNSIVQGLVINDWQTGVLVAGDGDIVRGNFIGTDVTGTDTYP